MNRIHGRGARAAAMVAGMLMWAAAVVGAWTTGQPARTVNDGVYTEAQAERGAKVFETTCTACHDPGRFTGDEFLSQWTGKPLADLWDVVNTMPEDNPGSLKAQEYADVISFFLQLNSYPAGAAELQGDAAAMAGIAMAPRP